MAFFRNYYRCVECGHEWTDMWSVQCDDDCPRCGARHMSPYKSEDVEEVSDA
jgi:DNA-directed RNA polymerase subunit RPC12/RpoP